MANGLVKEPRDLLAAKEPIEPSLPLHFFQAVLLVHKVAHFVSTKSLLHWVYLTKY